MSSTVIYKFKKNGDADFIGETQNSARGAMLVWMLLEKKYLPKYIPSWAFGDTSKEYSRISSFDESGMNEIWALAEDKRLSEDERIVLNSTFDNVVVLKDDILKLLAAFRSFEGETSLKEQADIIENSLNTDYDLIAVAWNQTSVNSDAWESDETGLDEDGEEIYLPYNLFKNTGHWNLFESKQTHTMHNDINNNDKLPIEARLKHLEQEAQFVREWVDGQRFWKNLNTVLNILIIVAIALNIYFK